MLLSIIENPIIPFALSLAWVARRNKSKLEFGKAFTKEAGWAALELTGAFVGSFVIYPLVLMPRLKILAEVATSLYESSSGLNNYSLMPSFSGLKHNVFSANIGGTILGLGIAWKTFEMWDEVASEVGKDNSAELREKFEKWAETQQERDKVENASQALEGRIQYASEARKFFKDHPYALQCAKCAAAGSLGILSVLVETNRYNFLHLVVGGGSYLATSALTHYLTSKPGDPLAVKIGKTSAEVIKSAGEAIYEGGTSLAGAAKDKLSQIW